MPIVSCTHSSSLGRGVLTLSNLLMTKLKHGKCGGGGQRETEGGREKEIVCERKEGERESLSLGLIMAASTSLGGGYSLAILFLM